MGMYKIGHGNTEGTAQTHEVLYTWTPYANQNHHSRAHHPPKASKNSPTPQRSNLSNSQISVYRRTLLPFHKTLRETRRPRTPPKSG